jgi:hypothetical protein
MGAAALLVALTAMSVTVAGVKSQDGESIATSFLSGQFTDSIIQVLVWQLTSFCEIVYSNNPCREISIV